MACLSTYHKKNPCLTFLFFFILLCWLAGGSQHSYAQQKDAIPTVKVNKKPKKPVKIHPDRRGRKVKDNYRQPRSKSSSEDAKDQYTPPPTRTKSARKKDRYKQPLSKSHDEKDSKAKTYTSPPAEEGGEVASPTFWQRVFKKKAPSTFQGELKPKQKVAPEKIGTQYAGHRQKNKIDFESLSKDVHAYEGHLKTRQSRQKADKAALFEGKMKGASQKKQIRRHQQLAKDHGAFQGHIKVPHPRIQEMKENANSKKIGNAKGAVTYKVRSPKNEVRHQNQVSRKVGMYAGAIKIRKNEELEHSFSFHQGHVKVPTRKHQTRIMQKLSREVHQFNGALRVRKAGKDMHPSVSYLKSKTKNSYEQKEKYRKWKIKWHGWFKSKDQPKHLKTKSKKPRYDNKEKEIWYY